MKVGIKLVRGKKQEEAIATPKNNFFRKVKLREKCILKFE